jgi:hypothetical protein
MRRKQVSKFIDATRGTAEQWASVHVTTEHDRVEVRAQYINRGWWALASDIAKACGVVPGKVEQWFEPRGIKVRKVECLVWSAKRSGLRFVSVDDLTRRCDTAALGRGIQGMLNSEGFTSPAALEGKIADLRRAIAAKDAQMQTLLAERGAANDDGNGVDTCLAQLDVWRGRLELAVAALSEERDEALNSKPDVEAIRRDIRREERERLISRMLGDDNG